MNRVAVTGIEEGMSEVGKRRAMRAASSLMIEKRFARKFVELSHDLPPALAARLGWVHDEGNAGGNASFCRSLLTSPSGVAS